MGKDKILKVIAQNKPEKNVEILLPEIPEIHNQDLTLSFDMSLQKVGGSLVRFKSKNDLQAYLADNFSNVIDFELDDVKRDYGYNCSLEKLNNIEVAMITAKMGVVENGAIWLDDTCYPHRIIPFITQNLIIRLQSNQLVSNMHIAYRKINPAHTGYGVFISGPSKTADIEQSLVYGAHGARQLIVLLLETD